MSSQILIEKLLSPEICLVIEDGSNPVTPASFSGDDSALWLAFSDALSLARFCEAGTSYIECSAQDLIEQAIENKMNIGFDMGTEHGRILNVDELRQLDAGLRSHGQIETKTTFEVNTPKDVDTLIQSLKHAIIGLDCELFLFQDPETGFVLAIQHFEGFNPAKLMDQIAPILHAVDAPQVSLLPLRNESSNDQALWQDIKKHGIAIKAAIPKTKPPKLT